MYKEHITFPLQNIQFPLFYCKPHVNAQRNLAAHGVESLS